MKYLSTKSVVEAYQSFQECMTNKSWGYLSILKACKGNIRASVPYKIELDEVSCFLENIFNLSENKRVYEGGRSFSVMFSNKWNTYFNDQGKNTPNIYDVAVWAYRREGFVDDVTNEDILKKFAQDFNMSVDVLKNCFNTKFKDIEFSGSLYSETDLKLKLSEIGVDVSKNNIDAKKSGVVASPGEISRGPFIQPLYAALEITDYVLILQSDYTSLYSQPDEEKKLTETCVANDKTKLINYNYRSYITAIKSKPFLLLAGISGTGKSRIVRELARACWDVDSEEYKAHKPKNFEMVQVKPNWHDSSELIGYVSRVSGEAEYIDGPFLQFIAKAWSEPDIPHFLCLDEMNLAPVEQYFAEFLSVVESRKNNDGKIETDPILKGPKEKYEENDTDWYSKLVDHLTSSCCNPSRAHAIKQQFLNVGITIPQNLIVVGTVNMDETTFSFSRKVLDRAMTIEMNKVDLEGGLTNRHENIGKIEFADIIGKAVEGVDVYAAHKGVCDRAIGYLESINAALDKTPFKVAYRTRNELLLYVVNNLSWKTDDELEDFVIARALDEITCMKILTRIEGDETKVSASFLDNLGNAIKSGLVEIDNYLLEKNEKSHKGDAYQPISLDKLDEMKERLKSGYTNFWG